MLNIYTVLTKHIAEDILKLKFKTFLLVDGILIEGKLHVN